MPKRLIQFLIAVAALVLTHTAIADVQLRGDLTRDGLLTDADVAAAEVFFADPRAFWDANPGWTLQSLRRAADVDRNGLVEIDDKRALARAVGYAAQYGGRVGRSPVGDDGWTHVSPAFGALVIYVSSSQGSDRNHGMSPDRPVATIEHAYDMLRDRHGDHILLRSGDTWNMQTLRWRKSGLSHRHPMLISAYGEGERPTIIGEHSHVIFFEAHHLCIIGLRFTGAPQGSAVFSHSHRGDTRSDLLVEDCVISGAHDGLNFQYLADAAVRRCIITDTKRQGLFSTLVNDLTIEQNFFDRNGSNHILDHNIYASGPASRTRVIDNLLCRGANFGLKFNGPQTHGDIAGNVVFASRNGFNICSNDAENPIEDTVIRNNVITEIGRDGQSIGLYIDHTHRVTLANNLIANPTQQSEAIRLLGRSVAGVANIHGLTLTGNTMYGFPGLLCNTADFAGVTIRNNTFVLGNGRTAPLIAFDHDPMRDNAAPFAGNTYDATAPRFVIGGNHFTFDQWKADVEQDAQQTAVAFADPSRGVESYAGTLGMTTEQLLDKAAARPRGQWDQRLSAQAIAAYIREGFDRP